MPEASPWGNTFRVLFSPAAATAHAACAPRLGDGDQRPRRDIAGLGTTSICDPGPFGECSRSGGRAHFELCGLGPIASQRGCGVSLSVQPNMVPLLRRTWRLVHTVASNSDWGTRADLRTMQGRVIALRLWSMGGAATGNLLS